jgi:hypothetical protein
MLAVGLVDAFVIPAIVSLAVVGCNAFRGNLWRRRAHKLARTRDIALPDDLEDHVARVLRNTWLCGLAVNWVYFPLANGIVRLSASATNPDAWFPLVLAAASPYLAVIGYVYAVCVRWRASGQPRVAHLRRLSPWLAFTVSELCAVALGAVCTAVTIGYGLHLVHAAAAWWAACAAGLVAAAAAWWYLATALMDARSNATDQIELGWDDVLRFEQVRSFTRYCAWLPAIYIFMMNQAIALQQQLRAGVTEFSLNWIFVPFVIFWALERTFRQGRRRWRRAWE